MNLTQSYREVLNEEHSKAFIAWFTLSDANKASEVGIEAKRILDQYTLELANLNKYEAIEREANDRAIYQHQNQD